MFNIEIMVHYMQYCINHVHQSSHDKESSLSSGPVKQPPLGECEPFKVRVNGGSTKAVDLLHAVRTHDGHTRELAVELTRVEDALNVGTPWRRDVALAQPFPVDGNEELVALNLCGVVGSAPQPPGGILGQQSLEDADRRTRQAGRVVEFALANFLKELVTVRTVEGRQSGQHFVEQRPEAPPVDCPAVPLSIENLGRQVFWRPAKAVRTARAPTDPFLRKPKVGETNVTFGGQQDVLWLEVAVGDGTRGKRKLFLMLRATKMYDNESLDSNADVPVHNVQAVHILDGQNDFRRVEAGSVFREAPFPAQVEEKLTTGAIVQHKVQLVFRLEGHVHAHDEGVLNVPQHTPFRLGMFHLVALDDVVLVQHLERVDLVGFDLSDQEDFSCVFERKKNMNGPTNSFEPKRLQRATCPCRTRQVSYRTSLCQSPGASGTNPDGAPIPMAGG